MKQFVLGCALGAVVAGAGAIYAAKSIFDQPVMFPSKRLYKYGDQVEFEGSIFGEGDASQRPVNNYIRGECSKAAMNCKLGSMDEISNGFIGAMWKETIPIRSWNGTQIVADSKDLSNSEKQCNWYQIKINLQSEHIDYTRYPNEYAEAGCSEFSTEKVHRWRIDNGRAWKMNADGTMRN